ncbi:hypothetical protein LCGC14_2772830, partial [marine sediment metagenome]
HDLGALHISIDRFGYTESFIWDERAGCLVAGHGRLEVLLQKKKAGEEPPEGIVLKKGEWLAPVQRGWASKSDADHHAYLVASNRLVQLGGWDDIALAEVLKDLASQDALDGSGYDLDDLDELINSIAPADPPTETPIPKIDEIDPYVKFGDVWELGAHTVVCGDCRDTLPTGPVDLVLTDPPYGMDWAFTGQGSGKNAHGGTGSKFKGQRIAGDTEEFDPSFLLTYPTVILWGMHHYPQHLGRGSVFVWVKKLPDAFGTFLSDADVAWMNRGHGVYVSPTVNPSAFQHERVHPTQKPVELMEWCIEQSKTGGAVLDPFIGSGTTLIACEKLGRRCYMMEIDEHYCDVIIKRWEDFTGKEATKE